MQSNNGDLYFRAGIDLDGFNAGADAMERKMKDVTSTVVNNAGAMDDAISKIGGAFTKIVGVGAAGGFVKEMFNVRSEMQNTEAMLRVFLGSAEKADKFFKSLQGYAYNNVFEFKDLAKQSAQLLAYRTNVEEVIPTLNKLSEIAAGTNTPLEELVTVFNKVKATNKLDSNAIYSLGSKGIDVRQAIAEIRELETGQRQLAEQVDVTGLKFQDLQKIIDHVATDGGMFDGMMVEKMKTLGDSWGLMQDNLTNMFNEIGAANQGLLKSGMDVGNYLIEHYQSIAKVLGTLVVAFGTAKAASIALNTAQKNGTGVAVIDNTVWAIRGNLLKVNAEQGKNITASIRQINAAQKEEIATLKASVTEQEHEEILRKSRVANLDDVLDATQKARLAQMGLNGASEDYVPIAMSMLTKEQQMQMAKAELTKNNAAYIAALKGVVGMHGEEINTLDDRIEAASKELALAEKAADAAADEKEHLEKKVKIYQDYYEASLNNIDATDLQERTEALETAQSELEAAAKNAEAAAETRNTAQKKLNELQTKKNAVAEGLDTNATNANATAKNFLTLAVGKLRIGLKALWAIMKANPVGAVVTVVTSLYTIISHFVNKSKEAKEAQEEENKELAEFQKEVNTATDRLNTLRTTLTYATKGSKAYNDALKQVNDMCMEYNVELINTNDNLQTQKEKYEALETAIKGVTAAKLREQYATIAMQNQAARNEETMGTFRGNLQSKKFVEGFRNVWDNETKFNTMWNLMLNKAQWTANGDDHTYIAAVDDLFKAMRQISGFPIDRNGAAADEIRNTIKTLVESAREAKRDIKQADDVLKIYEQSMNAHDNTTKQTTTSVADLNKQLEAQKKIIDKLQKKAKNGGLTAEEEAELSQARTQKDAIEKRLKNFTGQTTASTNKSAKERQKAIKEMNAAELQLLNEREEAEISMMADGAAKRQRQLQLEYQQRLQAIKKEEEEYIQQRKDTGESGVIDPNSDAGKSFAAQRLAAEQEYQEKARTLFDDEVEYRRQQYENYNRWVTNVSQEAADREFRDLIADGQSFAQWLDNEIARLELKKQENGGLESNEENYLTNLRSEQARNEADSYKKMEEQMNKEIEAATTLAEKLEIINRWLEKIKGNGGSGNARNNFLLNTAQLGVETSEQMQTEQARQFSERYQLYNKQRTELEKQYLDDISRLNKEHRTLEAEETKRAMEQALQELDTDFLKGLVSTVFKNPTKSNMREAMKTLQAINKMTIAEFNGRFGNEQFQLTQEQFDAIKASIGGVNTEIKKLGQGYTLSDAFKDIRDGRIEGDMEKVARGTEYMQSAFSKFASVVSTLAQALNDLADASNNENLKKTAKTVNSVSNIISSTASMAGTGASIGGGWGALIGAVLGLGTGVLSEVFKSSAEKEERIAAASEKGLEFQQNVADHLTSILGAVESLTNTVTSLNYDQYRSTLLSLIEDLKESQKQWTDKNEDGKPYWSQVYDAVRGGSLIGLSGVDQELGLTGGNLPGIWNNLVEQGLISQEEAEARERAAKEGAKEEDWNSRVNNFLFGWIDDLTGSDRTHTYHLDEDKYKDLTAESVANYINWMAGQFAEEQGRLVGELRGLYSSNSYDSLEYYNKENEVYQSQLDYLEFQRAWLAALGKDTTKIDRQIAEMEHNMSESLQHMAEGLYGMDMGSIINEWISIFEEFGDNVDGAFNKIDRGIDKMIANMLRQRLVVEPLMEQLTKIFEDYKEEVGADHKYTDVDFIKIANRIREAMGDAYEGYQDYLRYLENLGIDLADITDTSTLTGSLQNLSEETGGVIAGRLNAMVINQADGNNFLRQSLLVQYEMNNHLAVLQTDVAIIKQRVGNSAVVFNENMNYGYS